MKILLISDLHSNIHALEAIEAAEAPFDLVLCAGDMIDWGMDPKPVLSWLRHHKHVAVRGNHDDYMLSADINIKRIAMGLNKIEGTFSTTPEPLGKETKFSTYTLNRLDEDDKEYLRTLPEIAVADIDGYTYCLMHSTPKSVLDAMQKHCSQKAFDEIWERAAGRPEVPSYKRRIVFGHSHQCWMHQVRGGALYLNPGSTSNRAHSEDNIEPGADYMVVENGTVIMRHISYPTSELRQRIREYGLDQQYVDIALDMYTPAERSVSEH